MKDNETDNEKDVPRWDASQKAGREIVQRCIDQGLLVSAPDHPDSTRRNMKFALTADGKEAVADIE